MKKDNIKIAVLVLCFLVAINVNAANQGGAGTQTQIQQNTQTVNQGTATQIQTQVDQQVQTSGMGIGQTANTTMPATGVKTTNQPNGSAGAAGNATGQMNAGNGTAVEAGSQIDSGNGEQIQQQDQIRDQQKLQDGTGDSSDQQQDRIRTQDQEHVQNAGEVGSEKASQNKSDVANAVQQMIQIADKNQGIGAQIKVIAQNQVQNQESLKTNLEKIQSRSGLAKFLIGPDYGQIKNAEKTIEQNREQIKQLNQIKSQITNQGDQQILTEQIKILEQANQEAQNSLNAAQGGFSLLGWLFKMFAK